jgi:hypothetical protein
MLDLYHKRKRDKELTFGKLIEISTQPDDEYRPNVKYNLTEKHIEKKIVNISDTEGLRRAKSSPNGIYQYYNKLYIYGTRDFPRDHIQNIHIPFDDSLAMYRGQEAEAAILSHREIDTVIGYSMGGSVALALEEKYPHLKSKTINAPVLSMNAHPLVKKAINKGISGLTEGTGSALGASVDTMTGYADAGYMTQVGKTVGGKIGEKINKSIEKRITDKNDDPTRIRYYGDPISALDFKAKSVVPSKEILSSYPFTHKYQGLDQPDFTEVHDVEKNPLTAQPFDRFATVITDAEPRYFLTKQPSDDKAMILTDGSSPEQTDNVLTF